MTETRSSRITITEKGQKIRSDLLIDIGSALIDSVNLKLNNTSSYYHPESPLPLLTTKSCRSGYFRPKQGGHVHLNAREVGRVYPNYMKKDPRQYPSKHDCYTEERDATPIPYDKSKNPPPKAKDIHHSLYKAEYQPFIENLTVKESNAIIGGRHGYIPMNMTTCAYPEMKAISENVNKEIRKIGNSNKSILDKRTSTDNGSMKKGDLNGSIGSKINMMVLPTQIIADNSWSAALNTTLKLDRTLEAQNMNVQYILNKYPVDKADQLVERHNQRQREYGDLLDKIDKHMKDKQLKDNENVDYLPEVARKIKTGGEMLDQLIAEKNSQDARYRRRLQTLSQTKYGNVWNGVDNMLTRSKSPGIGEFGKVNTLGMKKTEFNNNMMMKKMESTSDGIKKMNTKNTDVTTRDEEDSPDSLKRSSSKKLDKKPSFGYLRTQSTKSILSSHNI